MKIRYYGHIGQGSGYGRAASDLCMALLAAGVDLEIRPLSPPLSRVFAEPFLPLANKVKLESELDPSPDAVIVHTIPVDCAKVRQIVMESPIPTRDGVPWIAYTTWEALTRPVNLRVMMNAFTQVWSPSYANVDAFGAGVGTRILPHCFDPRTLPARRGESDLPRSRRTFYFYYIGAWSDRKNPRGLIEAYWEAFRDIFGTGFSAGTYDVALVLQCSGLDPLIARDVTNATGRPPVLLNHEHVSDSYILEMHKLYDCYVTASHGEAWDLSCFDAMLAGRHIVAPMGNGSDDYLTDTSATRYLATNGPLWREPLPNSLGEAMLWAVRHRRRDLDIDYNLNERYGYAAVAQRAINYLLETTS